MEVVADLLRDDDTPPPSGVRRSRWGSPPNPQPSRHVPAALALALPPSPRAEREVLTEVAGEVFFEVYGLVRALSPLQGAWLRLGLGQLGGAALTVVTWHAGKSTRSLGPAKVLRRRWPELVPGHAAMTCLASLMVDALC